MKAIFKGTPEKIITEMKAFLNKIDCKQSDRLQEERYYPGLEDIPGEAEVYELNIDDSAFITPSAHLQKEQKKQETKDIDKEILCNRPRIKDTSEFTIPKFTWDETKEKTYKTIRFCELDDGSVMLWYEGSRIYTTKEKIMKLPFPVPFGYPQLKCFGGNKKLAIRAYREFLNYELHDLTKKNYAENQAKEPEKKESVKLKTLEKKAEINKQRWNKDDVESKLEPNTKALRDMAIKMGVK